MSTRVLDEYSTRLIEEALKRNQWQKRFGGFTLDRYPDRIEVVEKNRLGEGFFRFGLWGQQSDTNYFFGIRGPWEQSETINDISELKTAFEEKQVPWRGWLWWYPRADRDTAYRLARQGIDPSMVFDAYVEDFFEKCVPLMPLVQTINKKLLSV